MSLLVLCNRYVPLYSGAAAQEHRIFDQLARQGQAVSVLTLAWPGLPAREELGRVTVRRVGSPTRWGRLRYAAACIWQVLARRRSQRVVLTLSGGWGNWLGLALAGLAGRGTLCRLSLEGADDPVAVSRQGLGWLKLRLMRSARGVICLTPALMDRCREARFPEDRLHLIPNAVDTEFFRPAEPGEKARIRESLGLPAEGRVTLFCGALMDRKGIVELLEAWNSMGAVHPDSILVLCGPATREEEPTLDPEYIAEIQRRVSRRGLDGRVRITGHLEAQALLPYLQAADLYVTFSRAEGLSNAVLEAMSSGLPVVAVAQRSSLEGVLSDGEEGWRIEPAEATSASATLQRALADPSRLETMGQAARRRIEMSFSLSKKILAYRRLIEELG